MPMRAAMDAVDHIGDIGRAAVSLLSLEFDREPRRIQVDPGSSERPENVVVLAQQPCKPRVAAKLWVDHLLGGAVDRSTGVHHRGFDVLVVEVVERFPYVLANLHRCMLAGASRGIRGSSQRRFECEVRSAAEARNRRVGGPAQLRCLRQRCHLELASE
jgi:hypothetical protein